MKTFFLLILFFISFSGCLKNAHPDNETPAKEGCGMENQEGTGCCKKAYSNSTCGEKKEDVSKSSCGM